MCLGAQEKATRLNFEIDGEFQVQSFLSLKKKSLPANVNGRQQSEVLLNMRLQESDQLTAFATLRVRHDFANTRRAIFRFDEAYLQFFHPRFDLVLGKQIHKWGQTILFSPSDQIFPKDYYDLLDLEKEELGVFSFKGVLDFKYWSLEVLAFPFFQSAILPPLGGRWFIRLPTEFPIPNRPNVFLPVKYELLTELPKTRESLQYGCKADFLVKNMDVSFLFFDGINPFPLSIPIDNGIENEQVNIILEQKFSPYRQLGITLSSFLGSWNIRSEFLYLQHEDVDITNNLIQAKYGILAIGIDRLFDFPNWNKTLQLGLQWTHQLTQSNFSNLNFNHLFQRSLLFNLDFQWSFQWEIALLGGVEWKHKGYYLQPQVRFKPFDSWKVHLKSDLLWGNRSSFFGHYQDNNRIELGLRYVF